MCSDLSGTWTLTGSWQIPFQTHTGTVMPALAREDGSSSFRTVVFTLTMTVNRICVGRDLAQQSLFINIATILWGTDITKATDERAQPIIPSPSDLVDKGVVV